jgi:hypothetical protein
MHIVQFSDMLVSACLFRHLNVVFKTREGGFYHIYFYYIIILIMMNNYIKNTNEDDFYQI